MGYFRACSEDATSSKSKVVVKSPAGKRVLMNWLKINDPDFLDWLISWSEIFGKGQEVRYQSKDEKLMKDLTAALRGAQAKIASDNMKRIKQSLSGN